MRPRRLTAAALESQPRCERLQELHPAGESGRAGRRGGTPNLGNLAFQVGTGKHAGKFTYGDFLTQALTFLISALVVYFILVLPVSRLLKLLERNNAATTRDCPECTMSIPIAAQRCPECTARIVPGTQQPQTIT